MSIIAAEHLSRSFGPVHAVDDISLQIEAGEIYGLVGSDGAGKTTTLRLLVGALKADAGQVSINGFDVTRQTEQARAQLGYLSQRFSLYEDLTVLENIRFFAELRGLTRQEWLPRCMEILDFVGLAGFKERRAGQLSGGMKQKLGLASALVTRPRVLLLDEPTTGVDPVTRQDFWQLLIRLSASPLSRSGSDDSQVAVLLTTPYMDEASALPPGGFHARRADHCRGHALRAAQPRWKGASSRCAAPHWWRSARLPKNWMACRMCAFSATGCTCAWRQPRPKPISAALAKTFPSPPGDTAGCASRPADA